MSIFKFTSVAFLSIGLLACGGGSGGGDKASSTFTVTGVAGVGGSLSLTTESVKSGSATGTIVTAGPNYDIESVKGCGGYLDGNKFYTGSIVTDCTITATFKAKSYTISVETVVGGVVTLPSISTAVTSLSAGYDELTKLRLLPDPGYHIESVDSTCGGSLALSIFTTDRISANCNIAPHFGLDAAVIQRTYAVTVASAVGGIPDATNTTVNANDHVAFRFLPDAGYKISSVTSECGGSLVLNTFTTDEVTANCTIYPHFSLTTPGTLIPSVDPADLVAITGTAARGAPIRAAEVTAYCADGSGFIDAAITSTNGVFSGQVPKYEFPCSFAVTFRGTTYYSVATDPGNVNITPITTLILAYASGLRGENWFAHLGWANAIALIPSTQTSIAAELSTAGYTIPAGDFLPFTKPFLIGDSWDVLFDDLAVGIKNDPAILTFDQLINQVYLGDLTMPTAVPK